MASGCETDPARFALGLELLADHLRTAGKDPNHFQNGVATMWTYVTEDRAEADRILAKVLSPLLGRTTEELTRRLLIGTAASCAQKLRAYCDAGAQRIFIWPVHDGITQLVIFAKTVIPAVAADPAA